MRFSDIPGHESVKGGLRELVASGHIPHALMLAGPPGAGKMLMARALAQYIHCENPVNGEPCGVCRSCRLHADLNHPDLHFVYPMVKGKSKRVSADEIDHWKEMLQKFPAMPEEKWLELIEAGNSQAAIYVDEANEIVTADAYPSYLGNKKIFLIWQPEKLRVEAANKLLKVIEEPSDGTMFILVSDNELQLLPTIFSRTQRFHMGRFNRMEMEAYLRDRYGFNPQEAMRYAPLCEGSIIKADEFGGSAGESDEFLEIYKEVMRAAYARKVAKVKQLSEMVAGFGREKIRRFLSYMARMVRENFIFNMKNPALSALTPEEEAFSRNFSPFIHHGNVEEFMRQTDLARRDIERNGNSRLILFDYFVYIIILLRKKPT